MDTWYVKAFLLLGGAAIVWKAVNGGVPKMFAWLLPKVVHVTHLAMAWLLAKPFMREALVKNHKEIEDLLGALATGLKAAMDAAIAAIDEDLDKIEAERAKK